MAALTTALSTTTLATTLTPRPSHASSFVKVNGLVNDTLAWLLSTAPLNWLANTSLAQTISIIVHRLYLIGVLWPLQQLYHRGFWNGRPLTDICAQLTQHRSEFWRDHLDECLLVIDNNFDSWLVWMHFAFYVLAWLLLVRGLLRRCNCCM
jgi:hypothetical protein